MFRAGSEPEAQDVGNRAYLVRTHQPAVAGNVGCENGRELAFDLIRSHRAGFLPAGYPINFRTGFPTDPVRLV
jgi:hypothetical protein